MSDIQNVQYYNHFILINYEINGKTQNTSCKKVCAL